ncbi:MAG: hypothetical protein AB1778_04105 [Candidatus Bipolaricaulota bacterium]
MKNALLLVGTWVGIILFAYAVAFLPAERAWIVSAAPDVVEVDAARGLAIAVPAGWSAREDGAAILLVSPISGVDVWALSVDSASSEEALAAAWETIDPCSSCERSPILETSASPNGERTSFALGPDGEGRTGRAVVLTMGAAARVLIIRRSPEASLPARVEADLGRIESGFRAVVSDGTTPEPAVDVSV